MIEIAFLLVISWGLVWLFEKGNLSVLGLRPTKERLRHAAILFLITAICCSTGFIMRMYFAKEQFMLNPEVSPSLVLTGLWLNAKSVLFEELLCRGVGLYILIKMLGEKRAILISAIAFGVFHWLNAGVFGNLPQMGIVFSYTFIMGLLLAYAYAKSRSLYLPFAIHFGWNLTQNFVFPDGPFGNQLFIAAAPPPEVTVSYFVFFSMLLLPKVSAVVINYLAIKNMGNSLRASG